MNAVIKPVDLPVPDRVVLPPDSHDDLLTPDALAFLTGLHDAFEDARQTCLATRRERQTAFDAGALPDFRPATRSAAAGSRSPGRSIRRWSSTR